MNRRSFLTLMGGLGIGSALGGAKSASAAGGTFHGYPDSKGVLHDTTLCIGCRRCEQACNKVNDLPKPEKPFTDLNVLNEKRRTSAKEWTVVNKYRPASLDKDVFRESQCMHCEEPACASACFVKAFTKNPDGSVTYDPTLCVGCRYCMIACPFYVPGFEYDEAWDPLVQKCTFCEPRLKEGKLPGCVEACPMDALTFGRRSDLIKIARKRIAENPGKYVDYIYGEWDAGGTAWMVLAPKPTPSAVKAAGTADAGHTFKELGLDTHLGNRPMGELTYGALGAVPMIIAFWPILFGGAYGMTKRREAMSKAAQEKTVQTAKEDVTAAMDAAVRSIEQNQGPVAADEARKAMIQALKAREAQNGCDGCCGCKHGEDK